MENSNVHTDATTANPIAVITVAMLPVTIQMANAAIEPIPKTISVGMASDRPRSGRTHPR